MPSTIIKAIGAAFIGLLCLVMFLSTYFTVEQNERTVVTSWGQFNYVADPGLHFKVPFRDSIHDFATDIQSFTTDKPINTYSADNQEIDVVFTVQYRVLPDAKVIEYLFNQNRNYIGNARAIVVDRVKAAMGQINTQSVAQNRGQLRDTIKRTLAEDLKEIGLQLEDFQLTDLQFTQAYREAINKAAIQKAAVEQREYARQEAVKEAERAKAEAIGKADSAREAARGHADATMLNAKANADARVLAATAEARAIQMQGEAQATAIKAQADALKANADLTELRKAERWDGKLPTSIYAGAPIPFMNLSSGTTKP